MLKRIGRSISGIFLAVILLASVQGVWAADGSDYEALGLGTGYMKSVARYDIDKLAPNTTLPLANSYFTTYQIDMQAWGASEEGESEQWLNVMNGTPANFAPNIAYENGTDGNIVLQSQYAADNELNGTYFRVMGLTPKSKLQAWEARVKLPSLTDGETRLFYYTDNTNQNGYRGFHSAAQATSPVGLRDGKVYTANYTLDDTQNITNTNPSFVLNHQALNATMEAGKWYRIVRMMDLRDEMNHKQKIMLFDENDMLLETSEWLPAGSYRQSTAHISSITKAEILNAMSFFAKGYTASVLFDDIDAHDLTAPAATIDAAKNPDVKANQVGAVNPVAAISKFGTTGTDFANFAYGRYSIDICMPDTTGKVGLFGLVAPKANYLTVVDNNYRYPTETSHLVYINNGTVNYSTFTETTPYFSDIEKNCSPVSGANGEALQLTAGNWYRFILEADLRENLNIGDNSDAANHFQLTVVDRATGAPLVTDFAFSLKRPQASKSLYEKLNQLDGKNRVWHSYAFADIYATGLKSAVYFDNISRLGTDDAGLSGTPQVEMDFDAAGCEAGMSLPKTWVANEKIPGYPYEHFYVGAADTTVNNNTIENDPVENADFIQTGVIPTNRPANVIVTFSEPMDENTVNGDTITFTTRSGSPVEGYFVSYDAATRTATLELGELEYETDYVLHLSDRVQSMMGLGVAEQTVQLTVVNEPFTITGLDFVDENGVTLAGKTSLDAGDKVCGKATLTNNGDAESPYLLILVLYKEGRMVDVSVGSGTLSAGEQSKNVTTDDVLTVAESGTTAAVMVWDDWENMKPRSAAGALPAA